VILNKSLTRRQANITALAISLADRQISQIRLRIYLVAESLIGTRLFGLGFAFFKLFLFKSPFKGFFCLKGEK